MTSHRIETLAKGVMLCPGDCLDVLKTLESNSIDACVTDPPYGLEFMGKEWDKFTDAPRKVNGTGGREAPFAHHAVKLDGSRGKNFQAFSEAWAREVIRVLKPGGHLLSFGGTRTYHRMACAIEDAGFEIRDSIQWLYGSGFPKSLDVSKAIDKAAGVEFGAEPASGVGESTDAARKWSGFGTALKPACEPIVLARKPLSESTVAANVLKWGTGALNIDACRVGADVTTTRRNGDSGGNGAFGRDERKGEWQNPPGRFPANVIHDGSDEVVGAFPETKSGEFLPHHRAAGASQIGTFDICDRSGEVHPTYGDSGSAARFFYTAKADGMDRLGSKHPTVKPLDLIQYLVRLVTPPRGLVLDPFAGTGTAGEACIREGMRAILIEREAEYCDDIRRRMWLAMCGPAEREREAVKHRMKDKPVDAGPLFSGSDTPPRIGRQIYRVFADEQSGQRD